MPLTGAATKVKDAEYSNWLRVGLALYYLKDGFYSFIQREVDAMHQSLLQKLYGGLVVPRAKCSCCNSKDVKQKRNTYAWKFRSPCPSSLCDVWLKELLTLHTNPTSNKIYWENCDVTAWPCVPWECAKLYMPRGQPPTNISPAHSDAQALLTLMASCTYFHGKLSPAGLTLTRTVSTVRNRVMHSGDMKLSHGDRKSFVQDIINLLQDKTYLGSLEECKQAVDEINRINNDSLDVCFNHDLEMKALRECVNDCRQELGIHKKDTEVTVESLKEEFKNLKVQFDSFEKETKDTLRDLDTKYQKVDTKVAMLSRNVSSLKHIKRQVQKQSASCSIIKKDVCSLKRKAVSDRSHQTRKLRKLKKEMQTIKASTSRSTEATDQVSVGNMESDIGNLRDDLIKAYSNLRCVQVSPIFEKMRCDIDNIYVDLVIEEKQDGRNTQRGSKYVYTQGTVAQPHSRKIIKVTSYKQIFLDERGSKFKRVYLRGKGGLGKTTFCRKVLHAWCNAHKGRVVAQDGSFQDEAVLKMFDLLFYINLRDVSVEEDLTEITCTQFPLEEVPKKSILRAMLKHNGDKVLFIIDGLDELFVKARFIENVVTRRVYPNCCFLVSSRPWKISQMELHEGTEIDLLLDLQGFSQRNGIKFAEKLFRNCYGDEDAINQFVKDRTENVLAKQLTHVPLLLLFLAQVWYENERSLPSKLHELYILFLNLMAERMKEKYKKDPNHLQMRFLLVDTQSSLPSKISETSLVVSFGEGFLLSLCEVAYHFLLTSQKESSLVFEETKLLKILGDRGKEKLDLALNLGILSVTDSVSYLNRKTDVTFLHKTMQEFFTAVYFIFNPDKLTNFISSIADVNDVLQNENVIVFLFGLMPELGNRVLEKMNELCKDDWETLRNAEDLEMHCQRLCDISETYLRCKEEVIGENMLLNVSDLYLELFDFDLCIWNPSFLQSLDLRWPEFSCFRHHVSVNLRGLTGLTYLRLRYLNCDLYLPESDSLSVLIIFDLELSSSCCDVLGKTLTGYSKLKRLTIYDTDLNNCLLNLSNMSELTVLHMSLLTLSSACCDVFGRTLTCCTKLKRLYLDSIDFHNCQLDFSNMTELTALYMQEVTLSSSCCHVLGMTLTRCTKLETLVLRDTNFHNCLLDLSNMAVLSELLLRSVTLSRSCCDVLCVSLTNCSQLEVLNLVDIKLYCSQLDPSNLKVLSTQQLFSCYGDVLGRSLKHCIQLKRFLMYQACLYHCQSDLSNMTAYSVPARDEVALSSILDKTPIQSAQPKTLESFNTNPHSCQLDLSNMAELNTLVLANVTLTSCCCEVLGRTLKHCMQLKYLCFKNTDLHNCQLDLSNMTELYELKLDGVKLSSSCCDVLGRTLTHCIQLKYLFLQNTDLNNCQLDLANMTELYELKLNGVKLSSSCCDVLCGTLTHCAQLKVLTLCNTDLYNCKLDLTNMISLSRLGLINVNLSDDQLDAANEYLRAHKRRKREIGLLCLNSDYYKTSILSELTADFDCALQSDPDSQSDID